MADTTLIAQDFEAFNEIDEQPRWLPFDLIRDEKRGKFDKVPNNGYGNVSTKAKSWLTLAKALAIKERENLPGITLNMTGGITIGDYTLIGFDYDDVDFARFELPFKTYAERSPSGKGVRMFAWGPSAYLAGYKNAADLKSGNCDHLELYFDGTARHLTVTGDQINAEPIARLTTADLDVLVALGLKPRDTPTTGGAALAEIQDDGQAFDLKAYPGLSAKQRLLVEGKLPQGERNPVVHGLLIKLLNDGRAPAAIKASMLKNEGLRQYLTDHRRGGFEHAVQFADEEIGKAYLKTRKYQHVQLAGFNPEWAAAAGDWGEKQRDAQTVATSTAEAVATAGGVELTARHLCSDQQNAVRLKKSHGAGIMFSAGRWYVWLGTHWGFDESAAFLCTTDLSRLIDLEADAYRAKPYSNDDEKKKNNEIAEALHKWSKASESGKSLETAFRLLKRAVTVPADSLDRDPYALNVANGTIDLRTGELRPQNRGDLITKCIPIVYDQKAKAPTFERVLAQITGGNTELAAFLQRWFGYCAAGDTTEQKFAVHHGDGANGKSLLLGIISHVLGPYAGVAAPSLLMAGSRNRHPTELADLFGMRLTVAQESGQDCELDEATVKAITGGDWIKARYCGKDNFQFPPTHTLNLSTNHRPQIKGTDLAMWRRVMLVPYGVTFGTAAEVEQGVAQYLRDDRLGEKLKAEAAGILTWLVQGAYKWYAMGLNPPGVVLRASAEYRAEQDLIGQFLKDYQGAHMGEWVPCSSVLSHYVEWCDREHIDKSLRLKRNSLYRAIRERPGVTQDRHDVPWFENGKTVNVPCFSGLKNG